MTQQEFQQPSSGRQTQMILIAVVTAGIVLLSIFGSCQFNRGSGETERTSSVAASDTASIKLPEQETATTQIQSPSIPFANFTETANLLNIKMIAVQGGTFTMGCTPEQGDDCGYAEKPAHQVTVGNFLIGSHEVTQKQWQTVMGNNPSFFKGDNLPVEQVSWNEVQEFITKLNRMTGKQYRLPTEAEWEFAARGGAGSRGYKYSAGNTASNIAWSSENSRGTTHPVGTKTANELGLYDMSGNVAEWCNDRYGAYGNTAQTRPQDPSTGYNRVIRGGSWGDLSKNLRVSFRFHFSSEYRNGILGFRLACSI
ncbi:MAG: formylglycine-generating enzyme family protein [Tannerella sp.]|jgi:formylglycine-generating enzyme required for sulfatase activity|nr:formylglycine-generating enzyme family protein [Tannerella sp.]